MNIQFKKLFTILLLFVCLLASSVTVNAKIGGITVTPDDPEDNGEIYTKNENRYPVVLPDEETGGKNSYVFRLKMLNTSPTAYLTDFAYAIGTDAENIVHFGRAEGVGFFFEEPDALLPDTDYKAYIGGSVNNFTVKNYIDVIDFHTPATKDAGEIVNLAKDIATTTLNVVSVTDLPGSVQIPVKVEISPSASYSYFNAGVYEFPVYDNSSMSVTLPVGFTYAVSLSSASGVSSIARDPSLLRGTVGDAPITIEFESSTQYIPVNVKAVNAVYGDTLVEGVTFESRKAEDDSLVDSCITGADGTCTVNIPMNEKAVVVETATPYGYATDTTPVDVVIPTGYASGEDSGLDMEFKVNPRTYKVNVNALNSIYEDVVVEGLKFKIFDDTANSFNTEVLKGTEYTTDAKGKASVELVYGHDYSVRELVYPYGYQELGTPTIDIKPVIYTDPDAKVPDVDLDLVIDPYEYKIRVKVNNALYPELNVGNVRLDLHDDRIFQLVDVEEPTFEMVRPTDPGASASATEKEIYRIALENYEHALADYTKAHEEWVKHPKARVYQVIDSKLTDNNGYAEFLVHYGHDFFIDESDAPFGYEVNSDEYTIKIKDAYPTYDFSNADAGFDLKIPQNPRYYDIILEQVDQTGFGVSGFEYSIYDRVYNPQLTTPFANAKTNSVGIAVYTVGYGHDYTLVQTKVANGYDANVTALNVTVPSGYEFLEPIVVEAPAAQGQKFSVAVAGVDGSTDKTLKTKYSLLVEYPYQANIESEVTNKTDTIGTIEGNGKFEATYSQHYAYSVKAATPSGYQEHANKGVKIGFDNSGKVKASDVNFKFTPNEIEITITKLQKGAKVTLYRTKDNKVIDTKTAESDTVTFKVPYDKYYTKIVNPDGTEAGTNSGSNSKNNNSGSKSGSSSSSETTTNNVIGVKVTVLNNENQPVSNVSVALFDRSTKKVAKNRNGDDAIVITGANGVATFYMPAGVNYYVSETEVPEYYIITPAGEVLVQVGDDVTKVPASSFNADKVKKFAEVSYTLMRSADYEEKMALDELVRDAERDVDARCGAVRTKIDEIFAQYKEEDYSKEMWARLQAIYADTVKKLEDTCSVSKQKIECDLENGCQRVELSFDNVLEEFALECQAIEVKKPWYQTFQMRYVEIAIAVLLLIFNLISGYGKGGIIGTIIGLILMGLCLVFDNSLLGIIVLVISVIANGFLLIRKNIVTADEDDDDQTYADGSGNDINI